MLNSEQGRLDGSFEADAPASQFIRDLPPPQVAALVRGMDWDFADALRDDHSHGMHPYPAKFIADLPRQVIAALSLPAETVLDPFCGGGTTGVEAIASGRSFVGLDANPLATAVTAAKLTRLEAEADGALLALEATLIALTPSDLQDVEPEWLPEIPNREKWYGTDTFVALGIVRALVERVQDDAARRLALLGFANAASRLSYQDSETRYVSRPRPVALIDVPRTVLSEIRRMRKVARSVPQRQASQTMSIVNADSRERSAYPVPAGSVGLVVTSPPYPNAYDYHLYHRFRIFWLARDPQELRRVEIGSHLKNQTTKSPETDYVADLRRSLSSCFDVLRPGAYCVLVVGDGVHSGKIFSTSEHIVAEATAFGFAHVVTVDRVLPEFRRSITKAGRRMTEEQVVFLRRPAVYPSAVIGPNYELFPYERELQHREVLSLGGHSGESQDTRSLERAAFLHGVRLGDLDVMTTTQHRLEGSPASKVRRKHSTYLTHGLHRYKGKFYPQLAKCLINLSESDRSACILDPFGGSGTLAVEATLLGFDAVSIDCNPLAVKIARAKVAMLAASHEETTAEIGRCSELLPRAPRGGSKCLSQFAETVLPELERWFPPPVLMRLDWLLREIRSEFNEPFRGAFEVLVSDIVRDVSQQEPRDLRIRRRAIPIEDAPVYELFQKRLRALGERLWRWRVALPEDERLGSPRVLLGDVAASGTLSRAMEGREIGAVVSSPPYAAALPYLDTDRLSLALLFGLTAKDRRGIERHLIGSRDVTERQRAKLDGLIASGSLASLPQSTIAFLERYRQDIAADASAGFRLKQAPAVLGRYFVAMSRVLQQLGLAMPSGARCWLVLGDSRTRVQGQWRAIPTVDSVAAAAELQGFALLGRTPITVTRGDGLHSRHAITKNEILELART